MNKTEKKRKFRLLIGKLGLDGHERGAVVITMALRDAGMEVIYTGIHTTPEQVVASAVQEDVDLIGISTLSGAHRALVPRVLELLRKQGRDNIKVVVGGIIPEDDIPFLKKAGVKEVFGPGSPLSEIVRRVLDILQREG